MERFEDFTGCMLPIAMKDVDTDMIIPAGFLTSTSRGGYGRNLFRRLRDEDPSFPLDRERYKGASILVARDNFGCGSSREHAVWALREAGFRAIIAPSFADIFYNNSLKNSLLPIRLPEKDVEALIALGEAEIGVSLTRQAVVLPDGGERLFEIDPFRKHCLVEGLDDLDYLLARRAEIERFFAARKEQTFFSTSEIENG